MTTDTRNLTPVDRHVAARLKERRLAFGLSQTEVGHLMGCTSQQVNKYELGLNRLSAGKLWEISLALETPIDWFFEGLAETPAEISPRARMQMQLSRLFLTIKNPAYQQAILGMSRILAVVSEYDRLPQPRMPP